MVKSVQQPAKGHRSPYIRSTCLCPGQSLFYALSDTDRYVSQRYRWTIVLERAKQPINRSQRQKPNLNLVFENDVTRACLRALRQALQVLPWAR